MKNSPTQLISVAFPCIFGIVLLASCSDNVSGEGAGEIIFPDSNVSYGKQVQPLFDRACSFSGCHGPDTFIEHGYSLDSYQNARSRAGIIVPYDPNGSILIQAVEGRAPNTRRMPPNVEPLTQAQIKGLRTWILEGAKNN